ncbi:MAG: hypothetical protein R6V33_03005 [Pelovirga sp.]
MKSIVLNSLMIMVGLSSTAVASETAGAGEGGFLIALFLGFFALIVVFQLVPATLMLIGILRGLFGRDQKEAKISR